MRFLGPEPVAAVVLLILLFVVNGPGLASSIFERDDDGNLEPTLVTLAEDVFDPIFAFMLGVVERDLFGSVDTAWFDSLATVEGGSKMPYGAIARLERWPGVAGADGIVRLYMGAETEFDIPYSILGYHPGQMRITPQVEMLHWKMGDRDLEFDLGDDEPALVHARDAHLFIVSEGSLRLDIDGWLDRLLGGRLDDVHMSGFFVFRDGREYVGLGFGYNPSGRGRTGGFDFVRNEAIFPASRAYLAVGRTMRGLGEKRLERWRSRADAPSGPVPGTLPVDAPR